MHRDWERRGLLGPLRILGQEEAARVAGLFRKQYAASKRTATMNRHVDLPVLSTLCEDPRLWAAARVLLDDTLLLWRTNIFLGHPTLPWHEDRYSGLFVQDAFCLSVLLAIEDSPPDNCTVVVPGSHRLTVEEKERKYGVAARYQRFGNVRYEGKLPARLHERMPLAAGEVVLLHPWLLHASSGFLSAGGPLSGGRLSCAFRVTTPDVQVRDEAFPEEGGRREQVLREIWDAPQESRQ